MASLPLSQIIAYDAPLLSSPLGPDPQWDIQQPLFSPILDFNYAYYLPSPPDSEGSHLSASPVPTSKMLKMSMTPDGAAETEQLCLPTHQVFDIPEDHPPTPSRSTLLAANTISSVEAVPSCGSKRSASPAPNVSKKRSIGERIYSKDFIPPDVSGLTKREARLVKNRAAAFLSRQRKREEFECMEVRVAELEQENARLLTLAQTSSLPAPQQAQSDKSDQQLVSEVEHLKAELAAAKERERTLSAQLATKSVACDTAIKLEATEPNFSFSSPPRPSVSSAHKSGASLGLMVLLCAIPSLLSMRMQPAAQTSFAIPNPFPTASASAFDYSSILPQGDYDWSAKPTHSALMDLDDQSVPGPRKLELSSADVAELDGLGNLDISFDASPSDNGKIRVRIHPSSASSSRSTSPDGFEKSEMSPPSSLAMWSGSDSESSFRSTFSSQSSGISSFSPPSSDPFLGVASSDYMMPFARDGSITMYENDFSSSLDYGQLSDPTFGVGSEYTIPDSSTGGKRRVRIALKSMPQAGGEGGEWEVQIC
jgi:hypothetical protein